MDLWQKWRRWQSETAKINLKAKRDTQKQEKRVYVLI